MSETPDQPLGDDEMQTSGTSSDGAEGGSHGPADAPGSDTAAHDGTDGSDSDSSDGSSHGPADAPGSDTAAHDGTDGSDSDASDA